MLTRSLLRSRSALSILALATGLASCADDPVSQNPPVINVPTAYSFESRFAAGQSSVNYGGQIVRNLLISDLTTTIRNVGKPGATPITAADLLKLYEHSDASALTTLTSAGTTPVLENRYSSISTGKKLSDKISSEVVIGFGKTADVLVREWFDIIATNSNNPSKLGTAAVYIDDQGRDLSQLITTVLLGSVSYYQGTGVYLFNILSKNNAVAATGATYTEMEHNWDEAFGYFGAARDMARYTDAQLAGPVAGYVYDSNGDGKIDLASEFNHSLARYAGKRDIGVTGVDFTKDLFTAFLTGRATIAASGTTDAVTAQRATIVRSWENLIAANVIHYLNTVLTDMSALTGESNATNSASLSAHWGEMKGFTAALQYNPFSRFTDAQLTQLHTLMGDAPVFAAPESPASAAYRTQLTTARDLIRTTLQFSEANALAW